MIDTVYYSVKSNLDLLENRIKTAEKEIKEAEKYIKTESDIQTILANAEKSLYSKKTSVIELLATKFLNETLYPDDDTRRIKIKHYIMRKSPAIDIVMLNNGEEEDIFHGQGGAVANIVSAALRIIVLAIANKYNGLRKFLILDEPDCWIKPSIVNRFFSSLSEVSKTSGIQMLYISHHSISHLIDDDNKDVGIVELAVNEYGKVYVENQSIPKRKQNQDSIAYIHLKNFMSHSDTLIPLSDGVTILTGPNNIGKSSVALAFRTIAYGNMPKAFLKHGAKNGHIELGIGNKKVRLEYKPKGKTLSVAWKLYEDDKEILSTDKKQIPDEILSILKMGEVDGMDVQIGNQKVPVFLINETPLKRASILKTGSEYMHLQKLTELWKAKVKESKKIKEKNENFIGIAENIIANVKSLSIDEKFKNLKSLKEEIEEREKRIKHLGEFISELEKNRKTLEAFNTVVKIKQPVPPDITDTGKLQSLITTIEKAKHIITALERVKASTIPEKPPLTNEDELNRLLTIGKRLSKNLKLLKTLEPIANLTPPTIPALHDLEPLKTLGNRYKEYKILSESKEKKYNEIKKTESEIRNTFTSLGYCPLCGRKVENKEDIKL